MRPVQRADKFFYKCLNRAFNLGYATVQFTLIDQINA